MNITINKTTVALLRGLNMTKEEMANKLGISKQELAEGLVRFGFTKSTKEPKRMIIWNDDVMDERPNTMDTGVALTVNSEEPETEMTEA